MRLLFSIYSLTAALSFAGANSMRNKHEHISEGSTEALKPIQIMVNCRASEGAAKDCSLFGLNALKNIGVDAKVGLVSEDLCIFTVILGNQLDQNLAIELLKSLSGVRTVEVESMRSAEFEAPEQIIGLDDRRETFL